MPAQVAKDLVNLGNAFCDQGQHADAIPLARPTPLVCKASGRPVHRPPPLVPKIVHGRPQYALVLLRLSHILHRRHTHTLF